MEFADIHTHILPDVDDGARTFEESVLMLREAAKAGVSKMLLTPHVRVDEDLVVLEKIATQYHKLKAMAAAEGNGIELHLGCELMIHPDLPDLVTKEPRLTVNGHGQCILFEMPMPEIPFYAFDVCFNLLTKGIKLVWAHPERCSDVIRDYRVIQNFVNNGVLIHLDAGSLTGLNGRRIKNAAETIVNKGLAHMLASDVHRCCESMQLLHEAYRRIKQLVGEQKAVELCYTAPSAILH